MIITILANGQTYKASSHELISVAPLLGKERPNRYLSLLANKGVGEIRVFTPDSNFSSIGGGKQNKTKVIKRICI